MSAQWLPADLSRWSGRVDSDEAGDTRRWHQVVRGWTVGTRAEPGLALIGFACDEGVRRNQGRPGAAAGPAAIRRALAALAWHQSLAVHDAGDVVAESAANGAAGDDRLEAAQAMLGERVGELLAGAQTVIVLGGGHEVAFGSHLGLDRLLAGRPGATVGIVNFDAHFDLRASPRASSGTPFHQIAEHSARLGRGFRYCCVGVNEDANTAAVFSTAQRLGVQWIADRQLAPWQLDAARDQLGGFVAECDIVHLSIDLDVLPAAVAPGVSAPAARGVSLEVLESLLETVLGSGKVVLADLAEYNPAFDIDQRTARVAARLCALIARYLPGRGASTEPVRG